MKFAHIALNCNDVVAVEHYYTKHFGFERARVIPVEDWELVFIKSGNVYLELFKTKENRPAAAPEKDGYMYPGVRHIAFQVDSVDKQLEQMGKDAVIKLGPLSFDDVIPGWKTVWVADPEGNIVEISQGFVDQPNPPALD
jgi:glyoxylase I family protein